MSAIIEATPTAQPTTVMTLIERAAVSNASIEQMAQLFELKLRVEADEARKAFNEAMARFKRNPPQINKNVQKKAGQIDLNYASLDNVVDTITPALSLVGIRHRWEVRQDNGWIFVTCVLSHDMGHSESTTLSAPYDASGGKNAIQAVASANTYLQRYTLLAATGLAAGGTDNDGATAGKAPRMAESEFLDWMNSLDEAASLPELQATFKNAYMAAQKIGDMATMKAFMTRKDKRKGEL